MKIISVLRRSREYTVQHAQWLHRQLAGFDSICMTDAGHIPGVSTVPLLHDWPGWFAKLEVFNPDRSDTGQEDLLLLDIDTVITGDLSPFLQPRPFTTLTDFYYEHLPQSPMASGVMYIPAAMKHIVWEKFMSNPQRWIAERHPMPYHGDGGFIGRAIPQRSERWQEVLPGAVMSYKRDIAGPGMPGFHPSRSAGNGRVPDTARIICFHGNPRPWNIRSPFVPDL